MKKFGACSATTQNKPRYSQSSSKSPQDLRRYFLSCKAEDAGGLTPAKDDNAARQKIDRKDKAILSLTDYL